MPRSWYQYYSYLDMRSWRRVARRWPLRWWRRGWLGCSFLCGWILLDLTISERAVSRTIWIGIIGEAEIEKKGKRARFSLFCASWRSSVTLLSCFLISCKAFARVINEKASWDLAVVPKRVRLPSSTIRCWRRIVSMIVFSELGYAIYGSEIPTSSRTRSWMSSKTRTDGASRTYNSCVLVSLIN